MEYTEQRQVHIDQLRQLCLDQRHEDSLCRLAHVAILHRGFADDNCLIDGTFAVCYSGDVKNGIFVCKGVVAGVIAEGSFNAGFVRFDIPFNHDVGICGDQHIDCFARDHWHIGFAEKPCKQELINATWQRRSTDIGHDRVTADSDSDWHPFTCFAVFAVMSGTIMVNLPVHCQGAFIKFLQPIRADIALSRFQAMREDLRQGNIFVCIKGPTFDERDTV